MIALALIENLFKTNFQWDDDDDVDEDRLTLAIFFLVQHVASLGTHFPNSEPFNFRSNP
jgi:hypothetical protein